jgi:hypothetical protein
MNTVMILLDRCADNPSLMTECGHADENLSPDRPGTLESMESLMVLRLDRLNICEQPGSFELTRK